MSFSDRADRALADPELRRLLLKTTNFLVDGRVKGFAVLGEDAELYRRRARAIRDRTFANLPTYLEEFVKNARASGSQVHFAADAAEARAITLELARKHDAKTAIKTKSMLTEEIHLRQGLNEHGIETHETDLGEWILQLADETPMHIIMPALHKSPQSTKDLFDKHLGRPVGEDGQGVDPQTLVARARVALRAHFIGSGIGITGANFAVAESGTLALVTNEGNGQHIVSGPPVQISLVPLEKIVPTLEDAATLLRVLVRSAGPQYLTTYTTWLTGPRRTGERDGPEEVHIILVDNGRSATLGTPLEEALRCIRCGACLNICPVYRRVGGQTYGTVYSGPIGIALTPIVDGADASTDELSHASSLCGACEEVCPVRVDLPGLFLENRRQAVAAGRPSLFVRFAFFCYAFVVSRPWLYRFSLFAGRWLSRLFARRGRIERGIGTWTKTRSMPAFAATPFRQRFSRRRQTRGS